MHARLPADVPNETPMILPAIEAFPNRNRQEERPKVVPSREVELAIGLPAKEAHECGLDDVLGVDFRPQLAPDLGPGLRDGRVGEPVEDASRRVVAAGG